MHANVTPKGASASVPPGHQGTPAQGPGLTQIGWGGGRNVLSPSKPEAGRGWVPGLWSGWRVAQPPRPPCRPMVVRDGTRSVAARAQPASRHIFTTRSWVDHEWADSADESLSPS